MDSELQRYKADFFKAMANPQRLALLEQLMQAPGTVTQLAGRVGLDVPAASRHLAQLKQAGVVDSLRDGQTMNYRLSSPQVADLMRTARSILEQRLDGTQAMLADLRESGDEG